MNTRKLIVIILSILSIMVWAGVLTQAQPLPVVQDCCQQAISYKHDLDALTSKYQQTVNLLEQTRSAGNDLIREKESRIQAVQNEANSKLTVASTKEKVIASSLTLATTRLDLVRSELENVLMLPWFGNWGKKKVARKILKQITSN
ncbi:hypothetical protein [Spirosoma litoris]